MRGAEGVILGCMEIAMLLGQPDIELPLFDTTPARDGGGSQGALALIRNRPSWSGPLCRPRGIHRIGGGSAVNGGRRAAGWVPCSEHRA